MGSEIEKMYENAGIEPEKFYNDRCRELDEWIKPFVDSINQRFGQ